jgi:hypothetical protein
MSISVEDWDDLGDVPRRRGGRRALVAVPPPSEYRDEGPASVAGEPQAAAAPRLSLVAAAPADAGMYLDEEAFGEVVENLKLPAYIAGANILAWVAGRLTGVVEFVGLAFFVSIVLLIASYLLREWHRDRTALICLAGALPLPITIISYLT